MGNIFKGNFNNQHKSHVFNMCVIPCFGNKTKIRGKCGVSEAHQMDEVGLSGLCGKANRRAVHSGSLWTIKGKEGVNRRGGRMILQNTWNYQRIAPDREEWGRLQEILVPFGPMVFHS